MDAQLAVCAVSMVDRPRAWDVLDARTSMFVDFYTLCCSSEICSFRGRSASTTLSLGALAWIGDIDLACKLGRSCDERGLKNWLLYFWSPLSC